MRLITPINLEIRNNRDVVTTSPNSSARVTCVGYSAYKTHSEKLEKIKNKGENHVAWNGGAVRVATYIYKK